MKRKFVIATAIIVGLLSSVSAKDSFIQIIPSKNQIIRSPSISTGGLDEVLQVAKRLGAKINITRQMNKLNNSITREKKSIPIGESRKYDVVTKGTKFIFLGKSDEPQLRPMGAKTATTINIVGGTIDDLKKPAKN